MSVLPRASWPEWDGWLRGRPEATVRQLSVYATALSAYGHRPEVVVWREGGRIRGGALLGIRSPGMGLPPVVHASGGIALEEPSPGLLGRLLDLVVDRCADLRACALDAGLRLEDTPELRGGLAARGFAPAEAWDTYHVDLVPGSDDDLMARFGKNPRRHIRKAAREGLEIVEEDSPAAYAAFEEAHRLMTARKGLAPLAAGSAESVLRPAALAGDGMLLCARWRGVPRNWLWVSLAGRPVYAWGALDEAAREPGCPQTGQALHFAAMGRCRARGHVVYDFGGAPGPVPVPGHANASVWTFKYEFHPRFVRMVGGWRRTLRPLPAGLLELARRGVRARRRATARLREAASTRTPGG